MAARYRCRTCGNLTRFDVVTTQRTRAFHHYSVAGDLNVEEVEVLATTLESVTCRWCGASGQVEEAPAARGGAGMPARLEDGEVR